MAYDQAPGEPQDEETSAVDALLLDANIAAKLDEEERLEIATAVWKGYEADVASRQEWEKQQEEVMKLAMQVRERKTFPWVGASNVKYPLLSTAAMQFAARAYPALIPSNGQVVAYRVIGEDPDGAKAAKAKRISQYMSWQLLEDSPDWEEDMDRMLIMLPIVGTAFKKTYYDSKAGKKCSHLVSAQDLVINYWTASMEDCERKTHRLYLTKRELEEKMRAGTYREVELPMPSEEFLKTQDKILGLNSMEVDDATPYLVLEQHRFWDLDDDGYAEPYVVTILAQTQELLRINARWASDGVMKDDKGRVTCIYPLEYFTKYGFIPNPDGGFYDLGFGLLLGPLNESVNTLINQLVDAGTLSTLQGGWVSKGLKVKQGQHAFKPGEWKQVDATLDDLKKGIFPIPVNEPSSVLYQLLGMLVTSTKELASVAEIFTGKMPGQNTPAYTTKETVEQGMKVFTAIYKRLYRALSQELKKLYNLNSLYFDAEQVASVTDSPLSAQDFQGAMDDVVPAADPQAASITDKVAKSKELAGLIQLGLDKRKVVARVLEAMEVPNYMELFPEQEPPSPEQQKMQAEMQMAQQELQAKLQLEQEKHQMELKKIEAELQALTQELEMKLQFEREKLNLERQKLGLAQQKFQQEAQQQQVQGQLDMQTSQQEMAAKQMEHRMKLTQTAQQGQQKMKFGQATHEQKMAQAKESANARKDQQAGSKGMASKPSNK